MHIICIDRAKFKQHICMSRGDVDIESNLRDMTALLFMCTSLNEAAAKKNPSIF